jgi:hypothetical protein
MGSFFRVFSYMGQVLAMIRQNPMLLSPLVLNIAIAAPLNIVLAVGGYFVEERMPGLSYVFFGLGIFALYFIDYFCAGLNTSMVADQVTTGTASLGTAFSRTLRGIIGIFIFAAVTAAFDLAIHYANQRRDVFGRMIAGFVRSIWTTATYVIMPVMLLEGLGFFAALKRSKEVAENDFTQVGVGYVGMGLVTWVLGLVTMVASGAALRVLMPIQPIVALLASFVIVNFFWAMSAWLKSNYYTCFYLWARECERTRSANPALAPGPLKNVLGGTLEPQQSW